MWEETRRSLKIILLVVLAAAAVVAVVRLPLFWRLVFPIPYKQAVWAAAEEFGVDPYLVVAIMRVESGFNPRAHSAKGAMGLMQLMPETGRWAADELGISDFSADMLYQTDINIRLGTWYLARLLQEFEGDLVIALAAYNGGSGNVRQWLENSTWSGHEHTLEDIPFTETREYVWKVLRNYRAYRDIYAADKH